MSCALLVFPIKVNAEEAGNNECGIQEAACAAYDDLINSFPQTRSGDEKLYPDNYGGAFITDEGRLIIYTTEDGAEPGNLGLKETVDYEVCEFSYQELNSIMSTLNEYKVTTQDEFKDEFNLYYLSCAENRIVVFLEHLTDDNIEIFKQKVCDSAAIRFEQAAGDAIDDANLYPGGSIGKMNKTDPIGSIGYRVKRNGQEGFITAGHVVSAGTNVTYENGLGSTIGKCEVSVDSGSVDAAFVKSTDSTYPLTNTISGTNNVLSTTISEPGEGTMINKCGARTGQTSGKIISTNATYSYGNSIFTNLVSAEYYADGGDSGGVVYSYVSSTGIRYTLGIHKGRNYVIVNGQEKMLSFYVKANLINSSLGTSRY